MFPDRGKPFSVRSFFVYAYSLVLNRRRVFYLYSAQPRFSLEFLYCNHVFHFKGWTVLYFTLVFNFSCLLYSMMSLLQLRGNAMSTTLSLGFKGHQKSA